MTSLPAAPHPAPPEQPELPEGVISRRLPPPWPPWSALAVLLSGFVAATVMAIIIGLIGAGFGGSLSDPPPAGGITSIIAQDLALIGAALLFARLIARPEPWQFALQAPRRPWGAVGRVAVRDPAFILFPYRWATGV